jgi:hypothetical protein
MFNANYGSKTCPCGLGGSLRKEQLAPDDTVTTVAMGEGRAAEGCHMLLPK